MKLPTSNKTASFGRKPYIKKGYYPAQLMKVEAFTDKEGNLKEGKYGHQLIFTFAVYKADPETGAPIEQMTWIPDKGKPNVKETVVIPKFVYHEYKDKKTGEFQTAITPNSAITKLLKTLGWEFSEDDVDPEEFLETWVEVNVDDYAAQDGEEEYKASTIKDINPYEGPEVEDVPKPEAKEPQKVDKQIKHEEVEKKSAEELSAEEIEKKIKELKKLCDQELLTEEGYNQAVEQLQAKLEEIEKNES